MNKLIRSFKGWLNRAVIPLTAQFHETMHKELQTLVAAVTLLQDDWTLYDKAVTAFLDVFKRARRYMQTPIIVQLDNARDAMMKRIISIIEQAIFAPLNDQEKAAAEQLKFLADIYRGAQDRDYESNTALVTHFLSAAASTKFAAAVATLALTSLMDALRTSNNDFQTIYVERLNEMEKNRVAGATGELRKGANDAIYVLAEAISALDNLHVDADTKDKIKKIAFKFNAITDQYAIIYHRHAGITASGNRPGGGDPDGGDGGVDGGEGPPGTGIG
ncbi:MAG: DUF6261 family protein [Tannerellaceae bacterium]|jgi:hypothetical protein|nr:DUF6261 family protein [Tannerellaceae bacterium]